VPAAKIEIVPDGVQELPPSTYTGGLIAPRTEDPMKGSDLIRAAGVNVEFVDDLPEAMKTARGMLYITRQEGLGSAALLAMSAGVPVLASRVGGLPEIVLHEQTGLLVDNGPAAIAAAASRLLSPEAQVWGENARQMVRERFLIAHTADSTLAAYRSLLGE
jgi:glycosyltransferase involved in cell wall biosynthesis